MTNEIVFATSNVNKIREIQALTPSSIRWISLQEANIFEDLPETSSTIEANSAQKAAKAFEICGLSCLAEDSGLEVESLNNEPGVNSARYAGVNASSEQNIHKLLLSLNQIKNRKARFKTVITFQTKEIILQFEGIVSGVITNKQRGGNGFGYDSVFIPEGFEKTFAEMKFEEKQEISHRKKAFVSFLSYLNLAKDIS